MVENSTRLVAVANREQLQPREQEGDHHRGEDFKESLDPQVNHPPAPVFGGDQMAALAVHQARGIEQRDRDAGNQEQQQQRVAFVRLSQGRFQARATSATARRPIRRTAGSARSGPGRRIHNPGVPNQNQRLPSFC